MADTLPDGFIPLSEDEYNKALGITKETEVKPREGFWGKLADRVSAFGTAGTDVITAPVAGLASAVGTAVTGEPKNYKWEDLYSKIKAPFVGRSSDDVAADIRGERRLAEEEYPGARLAGGLVGGAATGAATLGAGPVASLGVGGSGLVHGTLGGLERMGTEGSSARNFLEGAIPSAIFGAGGKMIAKAAKKGGGEAALKAAGLTKGDRVKVVKGLPKSQKTTMLKKVGDELLDQDLVRPGMSPLDVQTEIADRLEVIGRKIGDVDLSDQKPVALDDIIDRITKEIRGRDLAASTAKGEMKKLTDVITDLRYATDDQGFINPEVLKALRQQTEDVLYDAGPGGVKVLKQDAKYASRAARIIEDFVMDSVPDAAGYKELKKQYRHLKIANLPYDRVLGSGDEKAGGLMRTILGAGGAGAGSVVGNALGGVPGAIGGMIVGAGAGKVNEILNDPALRAFAGRGLENLARGPVGKIAPIAGETARKVVSTGIGADPISDIQDYVDKIMGK